MPRVWQLQEAKNKLSEVVDQATSDGPQVITRRGEEVAVVISPASYRQLTARKQALSAFFRCSPLVGVDLDTARDRSPVRTEPDL
jgi:prevent-host-death family protein